MRLVMRAFFAYVERKAREVEEWLRSGGLAELQHAAEKKKAALATAIYRA
jgi:hypothetical protein